MENWPAGSPVGILAILWGRGRSICIAATGTLCIASTARRTHGLLGKAYLRDASAWSTRISLTFMTAFPSARPSHLDDFILVEHGLRLHLIGKRINHIGCGLRIRQFRNMEKRVPFVDHGQI